MNLSFLKYCIKKYPELPDVLDEIAHALCREEGIEVFHLAYEVLNAGRLEGREILGLYTYTDSEEYQVTVNRSRACIEELEAKYKQPYEELCKQMGHETKYTRADFVLPRITLCDSLYGLGHLEYYAAFFHEIGHHFAVKEQGPDHDESEADRQARQVLLQRLPPKFHRIVDSYFKSRLRDSPPSNRKKAERES